jgi:hypothetical protein
LTCKTEEVRTDRATVGISLERDKIIDSGSKERSTRTLSREKLSLDATQKETKMPPKSIEQEIQARVAAFAADLGALIRQSVLDSLHQSLGVAPAPRATAAAAPSAPAAGPKGRGKGKRGKRGAVASGAATAQILDYVGSNPGSRLEQIAKGLGKASASLKSTVAGLLASGALSKTGQRRGTSYSIGSGAAPAAAADGAAPAKRRGRKPGPKKGKKAGKAGRAAKGMTKKKSA